MACCAFAAFILSQIILAVDAFMVRLGRAPRLATVNPNAVWRLDLGPRPASPSTGPRLAAITFTVLAVAVGAAAGLLLTHPAGAAPALDIICGLAGSALGSAS